jgi:phage/plasmid-like protein (TIGR03299 family)
MSVLDSVLDATQPGIFKIENDISKINGGSMEDIKAQIDRQIASIRAGGWDAAEYGRTAEQQIAILLEANTPEKMAEKLAELNQRAIARASLDVSNGQVALMVNVGPNGEKLPWHVLGTMVRGAFTSQEARQRGHADWEVLKVPASFTFDGKTFDSKTTFLLIRSDTGAELGSTGRVYKPIQNSDAWDCLDDVLKEFGAQYETVGAVYGGKQVWMQVRLPEQSWEVQRGDRVETFGTFVLVHDGTGVSYLLPTTERAVCANTLRRAVAGRDRLKLRHTGDIKQRIADARAALGVAINGFADMKEEAAVLVRKNLAVVPYVHNILDQILDITKAQADLGAELLANASGKPEAVKVYEKQIKERRTVLDDILTRYETSRCTPRGTAWAAYNAVSEHADHAPTRQRGAEMDRLSRRWESVLVGDADEMKQLAWATALASN